MKKLSKSEEDRRAFLSAALREAEDQAQGVVNEINDLIDSKLAASIEAFNNVVFQIEEFRDSLVKEMENYFDEQKESWQEGAAGEDYTGWKSDWESLTVDALEPEDLISVDFGQLADDLDGLNGEPGS